MSTGRMVAAVAATLLAVSVNMAFAQHAATPVVSAKPAETKPAEAKPEAKYPEAKNTETKRPPAAPATSAAAAVEQILRKLSEDLAKTPGKSPRPTAPVSHSAPPPRLQLVWRISLTWPDALTPSKP